MRLEAARADAARSRDALREVMADAKQASAATLLMERTQNDMLRLEERATAAEAALQRGIAAQAQLMMGCQLSLP